MLSKAVIEHVFEQYHSLELVDVLQKLVIKNGNHFTLSIAEDFDNMLESKTEQSDQYIIDWVLSLEDSKSVLARFLYVRSIVRKGRGYFPEAVNHLESLIKSVSQPEPFLLLHLIRLLVRMELFSEAASYLKQALSSSPHYSFYIKSEKIINKILLSGQFKSRKSIKLAILGSSTTSFLVPVIQAYCFRAGIHAHIYEGGYNSYRQEILDPQSGLHTFKPDAVAIILNHRDLALPPMNNEDIPINSAEELRNLWNVLQRQSPCHIVQVGFDTPSYSAWGTLEDTSDGGRARTIGKINSLLSKNLPAGVSFLDMNRVALHCGQNFHSSVDWYQNKQYPSLEALPVLAEYLDSHIRAAFGYTAKVLVLDLDNTLWGGVIGEDGLSGIKLGAPSAEGEAYLDLQQYAKELQLRGILLAVCSKNNHEDALLPFIEHDSMILKRDDIILFKANWQDKASNIKEIAQELSLGLDSIVFLDDNPLERAWVRSSLPDVIVPECGNTPWGMLTSLRQGKYFESVTLTEEDANRHKSYKSNLSRKEDESKHSTIEGFLTGLEMVAESGSVNDMVLSRVTQLINKTNQFNLTTRRYSQEQVRMMSESSEWGTWWFRLKDKFGDHGLIGVILVSKKVDVWHIDSFLMSCRVLGRKMERSMMSDVIRAAYNENVKTIVSEYIPTAKNSLVDNVYIELGFKQKEIENSFIYHIEPTNDYECGYIRSNDSITKD